ncbi:uncharacterized protein EAF01_009357 [Botrytis porri]|uniref:Uncharacterized protein n=1 Tax=Botrytis porri TaxID=87229 RepID=A0A4Z1KQG2_9HELO|nr:uncharacterized protein EAF01_009357 [Botrytis porri]KAF7896954.1 hypothetical protein EAF01_009357 [Botrytis porri]TGO86772.1 hypothetical protein BPOR_0278g00140 [Botrytis porri]
MTTSAPHGADQLLHERAQALNGLFRTRSRDLLNLALTIDLGETLRRCLLEAFSQPQIHDHNQFAYHLLLNFLLCLELGRQPRSVDDILNLLGLIGHADNMDLTADDDVVDLIVDNDMIDLIMNNDMIDLIIDDDVIDLIANVNVTDLIANVNVIDLTVNDDALYQGEDEDSVYSKFGRFGFCTHPPTYSF